MCAIILSRDTYKRKDGINLAGGRRFQAGLGSEHKRLYKEGQQINTLLLAQVIQVNYKYNTVDLLALQHKEVFQNSYANEGRFSARLPMEFGGRNLAGQPYGQVNPIAVGTVVLVGFINSDKDMPIVISVYNNNDVNKQLSRTRFANAEPTDMALAGQMYQKFSLYPSLTYDSIDGDGNRIVTFSGKSFIAFDTKDMQNSPMTDASYGSRYEDLGTSYYNDGELIEPMKGRAPNVLFKHQGILDDDNKPDTHNFMIHINPDGTYRTSMMDTEQDWRTMFEMTPEGKIRLRRQGDTVRLNDGFEIGELGINEEGIVYLRNGDMDLEVREDGIYSQGKLITESINLDDIYEKLANVTFEINKTNESLQILAGKSEVQDGKIVNLETEITIVAGKVESKVSATEVQDMIDSSIVDMAEAIKQAQEDADRANQIISDMASDNRLTPSEKLDLLKEWDIVKNEYPTYLAQAELYEVDSTTYTAKYKALETFVTPLLEDMEATSVVDGSIMRKTFSAYYTERINLLNAITKGLKDGLEEAMKKASQASVDATQALADSAQAQIDANNAKQLIADIASDGKLTASEKYQLKKEWDVIVKEYPTTIAQATKYKVNTDNYTAKYRALETFVTPLFANMNETSVVNGEQLRAVFSDYYAVKITLLKEITDIARDELTDYGNRITVAETKITQTSEAITLMASRVETVENDVRTNTAQLKVQADLISQKVTASEVKDAIDNAIDNMSIGGSNLFVINTQTAGLLNENNGTVGTAVDKSVVSNYIKVTARMPYVASLYGNTGTNSIIIAWYDTSKTFISGQAVADSGYFHKTYVAPENAVYARLSYKKSDTVKMKFEVGTKPTDYSPAWDDIKGDQTALEEYIKQVEEQAKQAQQEAENAKNEAENANSAIADMSNDNMLTANEKQQILLQWEEIKTEYPINLDQATKFGVSATQYTTAYNALKTYLDPLLADMTTTSVIIGSTMRSTFNTYYDRRTTLLNRVAELAKQVADQAKDTADKVDDDLNNIGGYNYIGFSSGDHMYPRLMIKNVGYYYIPSTTSAEFVSDMVCLKPKTATVTSVQYDVGNASASVADVGLANYRMKEVKTGQWLTASANLKVVGTGTAYLTIFTLENGSWKASYSDRVSASQGVTRVVAQRQVTDATTGILVRVDGSSITEVHFGNMQLEVGIRSTPWKKSDIDIQEDINNVADDIKDYIGARSDNLITNGFGELGNNTNIGGIFDGADRIVGKGSFRQEEANKSLLFSEHIVIDNKKVYNFDYYMHTLKGVGRSYAMIAPYDVDGKRITYPSLGGRNYNSTTPVKFTKLAKPLKVGDTEVFVEDVSLWNGQAPQDYQRSIIMWGYKNSFGYTYPDGTYSQLMQMRTYDIGAVDTTANKITLNKPWAVANPNSSDGIFPVGHTLSPTSDGSTYLYLNGHVNIQVPTTYTKYSHLISGSSEFANTTIIPVETGFIQLGFLLNRDTTGEKSWLNGLRLRDYTDTYKLNDDVRETQENVDKAQQDATKANQAIADLSNDNLVTPNEKLDLKKEWEIIVAEKPINDTQADKFGVSKVAYGTAYTALDTYLKPILASTTTNSAIVGQTMRDTFKAYYTARTDLLNAVATKAKDLADTAQSGVEQVKAKAEKAQADATKAQQDATKAQQDATKANQSIADLSNDNLVTPNEKLELKKEWEIIVAEKPKNDAQATKFGVSSTAYGTAYSALSTYLSPILTDLTTNSTIVGQTMRNTFTTYYSARTDLLNAVSTKAKELADQAQTDANNAGIKADNAQNSANKAQADATKAQQDANKAQESANKAQSDATSAQTNATKAQADANKANQSIADLSNDNLVTPNEKLDLKKEWEIIVAEKVINDAQADKFGVSKVAYGTAYTALSNYITPILTNLATNSAIVGQTMRDTFKAYYTARTDLLNAISTKAKELADKAQSDANKAQADADNAQSSADTAQELANNAQVTANKAQADATSAQTSATKAQADANKANQSISDLSNDNLVTPNEKLDLKKEWEIIVAEKPINDTQADKFGVSKTDYGTKYTALSNYITPILTDLTTNSAIVGQTMRDTFKAYYTARTNLLNSISVKAKELADRAQSDANNAQNSANNAQSSANQAQADATKAQQDATKAQQDANKANQSIADLSNDNLVTPNEKLDLKKEWEIIVAEKPKNDAQADKFGVSKTIYGTAYNALNTYLTPILANLTTNSAIVGQTMRDTFKTYYSARTDLLNAIASKAKDLADTAQDTADNIAVGTRNLLVGTKDFSKGKYPGNTNVTIANEKFNDNAVLKNDSTTMSGVYSDMYQITTSIVPSATQYTLSFYAKADVAGVKMNCYFYNPNTSTKVETNQGYNRTATDGSAEFTLSTKWEKYWVVWTQATPPDVIKSIIIGRLSKGTSPLSPIYMSSPMMVEGNKAQTWMKAPEDVETAINGKEGAWVYSPTAPTNPAIGLVWVDSSKTPNQPKRWTGGETGWVALTPEEVKDLPWGEDGSSLADWVAQAEQKISSDAIINTVLGSEDFTGIFDKKANTEDLNNLASYDDLDAMQAEYERLLKEGIAGIDFSPYVTNTELEQLKDSFTFSVQQAGGVNMLKNSLGFSGLDFWDDDSGRNFYRKNNSVTVTNPKVKFERTADTPNGFKLTGAQDRSGTVRINNVINSNGYWTVSFWLRGSQSSTSYFQMDICDLGATNFAVTTDNDWRKVSLTVNVTNYSQSTYHFVDFQDIAWAYFFIKDFKVEKGITATDWTPAPEDDIVFDPIVTTTQNDQLAKLGFGSGFMVNRAQNAILRQTIELPEAKQGLQYALSFYMNVATFGDTTGLQCGARIYEEGVLKYTVGITDATQGIPSDYHLYKLVFEPESPNTIVELFVTNGAQATVIISGVMYNIGNIALKWQPYPSEIYNTNVKIDINGITVKNNQTDGYTMITPQEFSGYARVNGEMERIFTLNGQVTEVKMLQAEKRITMEPISVFAMNSKETNTIGWAFVASGEVAHSAIASLTQ